MSGATQFSNSYNDIGFPTRYRTRHFFNNFTTTLHYNYSESLTTNHEVPGSIPDSTVGIFLEGEDSCGDHDMGRLVDFRFKAPPGTTSSSITT